MKSAARKSTPSTAADFLTMESLALPQDLYWDGKVEPSSPAFDNNELFSILEPHSDILANEMILEDEIPEIKPIELHTLLENEDYVIEFCDLKTEPWNNSPKLPPPSPTPAQQTYVDFSIGAVVTHPNPITKVIASSPFTADSVFYTDTTLTQLTPPQSPPQNGAAVFQNFNAIDHKEHINTINPTTLFGQQQLALPPQQQQIYTSPWNAALTITTAEAQQQTAVAIDFIQDEKIARDTQLVDEIIKNRVKELPEWIDNCETQSTCSAPSQAESVLADDEAEYLPDSASSSYGCPSVASSPLHFSSNSNCSNSSSSDDQAADGKASGKKRTRPYGRGVEDRKIRKKEQNKNAATRYRLKKKQEMASVLTEEQELLKRNQDLKRVLAERTREAKYLKSLIRELYKDQL